MAFPLMAIGAARLEVLGLNPTEIEGHEEANWPSVSVFGDAPFVQPTGLGDRTQTFRLAARPHVMGGLDQYAILQQHLRFQDPVMVLRLTPSLAGILFAADMLGLFGITRLGHREQKIAPSGYGYRWEFDVELKHLGVEAGGFE